MTSTVLPGEEMKIKCERLTDWIFFIIYLFDDANWSVYRGDVGEVI